MKVLNDAKKILGFSPITREDLDYLKEHNVLDNDNDAMKAAIREFLTL